MDIFYYQIADFSPHRVYVNKIRNLKKSISAFQETGLLVEIYFRKKKIRSHLKKAEILPLIIQQRNISYFFTWNSNWTLWTWEPLWKHKKRTIRNLHTHINTFSRVASLKGNLSSEAPF